MKNQHFPLCYSHIFIRQRITDDEASVREFSASFSTDEMGYRESAIGIIITSSGFTISQVRPLYKWIFKHQHKKPGTNPLNAPGCLFQSVQRRISYTIIHQARLSTGSFQHMYNLVMMVYISLIFG